jgi:hypothetical protein
MVRTSTKEGAIGSAYRPVKYAATTAATAKTAIVKPIHAFKARLLLHEDPSGSARGGHRPRSQAKSR